MNISAIQNAILDVLVNILCKPLDHKQEKGHKILCEMSEMVIEDKK